MRKIKELCKITSKVKNTFLSQKLMNCKTELVYLKDNKVTGRYEDLAPNGKLENTSEYFDALDWAFNNPEVYNIAVAGPYGSGKSSIIKSYIKKHPELKYINISLANFVEVDDKGEKNLAKFDDDKLEVGILKQLFYKVEHRKIPQSRYRKLHTISKNKVFIAVLVVIILLVMCMAFFIPDMQTQLSTIIENAAGNFAISEKLVYFLGGLILLILICIVSYFLWFVFSRVRIKELNIAEKATATTDATEENSIFNKNMDEIVYFFEATGYNVIFIEDLDRFKSTSIFIKLRELNTILNNYEVIKKRIVFIYAVKDDMFSYEERTKFFEFILPVIPIINSTNSGDILLQRLRKDCEANNDIMLSMDYITLVAPYIDDMRILSNIYNEFITYKKILQGGQDLKLSDQLMFSIMIFKNLYPKDFAELQAERGIVKEAFQAKKGVITNKKALLEEEKKKVVAIVESAERDVLENLKEVKAAMLFHMTKSNGQLRTFTTSNGQVYSFNTIMADEFDIEQLRTKGIVDYWYSTDRYTNNCDFSSSSDFMGSKDYIKRCKSIMAKVPEQRAEYQWRIESINDQIHRMSAINMKEMLENYEVDEVLPENVRANKLLVFLLRNGFIDEKYTNYMNYFHENSITKDDMNFILSVRNHEAVEFSYQLSQKEQIVKRLLTFEFEQKEIYNYDLMDYLLLSDDNPEKRALLLKQLSDENEISWQFIDDYFDKAQNPGRFIALLCYSWSRMWDYIIANQILTKERKDKYFRFICTYASIEEIVGLNVNGNVKKYYEDNYDILKRIYDVPGESIERIIEACDIRFSDLNVDIADVELIDWIFDNGYYNNTLCIMQSIFRHKSPENMDKLLISNYSAVVELDYVPLLGHLYEEFEQYIEDVVLSVPTNTEEKLESVLTIIEKGISIDNAIKLIQKENVVLDSLNKCSFDRPRENAEDLVTIWNAWIENSKLKPTWQNIDLYWKRCGVVPILNSFMEKNIDQLLTEECPQDMDPSMVKEIIQSDMETLCFEKFIQAAPVVEFEISIASINKDHMSVLLENQYFEFSVEFAAEIKTEHPDLYPIAIIINKEYVLKNIEEYKLDEKDLETIISSEELSETDKVCFITNSGLEEYTGKLALFLGKVTTRLSEAVFQKAWSHLKEDEKYQLFLNQISILSNKEISVYFSQLGEAYQKFADRSRKHEERLYNTPYNRQLVEHLVRVRYITSHWEDEKVDYSILTHEKTVEKFIVCRVKKESR
jgi:hypothetical protein